MTHSGASPAEYTPIFNWSPPRGRKVSLFGFLAASAVFHALCFYVFQIIYPPTVSLLPPPARVNLVTADSEQGRVLLSWVEAEDPSLASTTQRPVDAPFFLPPHPPHAPSYLSRQQALKLLPPYRPDLQVPSAQPPGPVPLPRPARPSATEAVASSLRFADDTGLLGRPEIPSFKFASMSKELPAASQFRVGISARGAVRYCFLENSAGDRALNEQARRYLLLCRFPSMKGSSIPKDQLIWTTAALEWGNDIAAPSASPPESPAP